MHDRSNRGNETAFSNFSGVVCKQYGQRKCKVLSYIMTFKRNARQVETKCKINTILI